MAARAGRLAGVSLLLALVFATVRVQPYVHRPYLHTNLYLPSGRFVKQASLGYDEIASDMVWFQAVQYYGGFAQGQHDLAYFAGLIHIVNQLDPHFVFPYVFGAVVLAQDLNSFDRGIEVLKRGMEQNPTAWDFPFEIGFLYYTVARDEASAAHYFELAGKMPGGGDRARRFAAFVYAKGGHRETSMRMWEEIARSSDEPFMRELAKHYLQQLQRGERIDGKEKTQNSTNREQSSNSSHDDL
jgi:hypothetical protein